MSATDQTGSSGRSAFSARTVLALILVGLVSLSAFAVLAAYAPRLRGINDPGAHALSSSAVGYRGAIVMLRAEGVPTQIGRGDIPRYRLNHSLVVATPTVSAESKALESYKGVERMLIVLPKWAAVSDPLRPGFVRKANLLAPDGAARWASDEGLTAKVVRREGRSRPVLRGGGAVFSEATYLQLGSIDHLQTLAPDTGFHAALVDERGGIVLAASTIHPYLYILSDPDLLNTQGLADLDTARAGMAILTTLKGDSPVLFDVSLNGFKAQQGIGQLMLQPPWLAATIAAVAASLLMLAHAFARFGAPEAEGRAIALGQEALVDNSAGLVRMAHKEPGLAPAYALLTQDLIGRTAGLGERADPTWLAELARRRGAAAPQALMIEAREARSRADLLAIGRKLYNWRLEITRERG